MFDDDIFSPPDDSEVSGTFELSRDGSDCGDRLDKRPFEYIKFTFTQVDPEEEMNEVKEYKASDLEPPSADNWSGPRFKREQIPDPIVDQDLCPRCRRPRMGFPHCDGCGWTEQDDLDSIKEHVDKVFPNGIDKNAQRAREKSARVERITEAVVRVMDRLEGGGGEWVSIESGGNDVCLVDTEVMQVPNGCIVRTILKGKAYQGVRQINSSMVFVPGVSLADFRCTEGK